jgi:mono/diheme cytochrome c family protein
LLYRDNCALCHGPFGEGGPNPTLPGDIIAPISTAEYLRTRDDVTLRNIISFGQPNFGMSPFGSANGGPLENEEIDAIIALFRSWEDNPPVETPPEVDVGLIAFGGEEVFQNICAQCHGANGEGGIGPTLNSTEFRSTHDDDDLRDTIAHGRDGTTMIPWGSVLSRSQIDDVIDYINIWGGPQPGEEVSFEAHIQPLLQRKCGKCHDAHQDSGGWRSDSYQGVMESGDNAPVVIPGDPDNSLMVQKLLNRQRIGKQMPPDRLLNERQIQWVIDWVQAGASDN